MSATSPLKNRKMVISEFGDVSKLKFVTEDIAAPGKNEVQVRIIYAGFSGADVNMRRGLYPMQRKAPLTPGYCFVGRVHATGRGCTAGHRPGDVVTTVTVYDSDADYINIPEKYLALVPAGVELQHAVALSLDWNTAYGMVTRAAEVSAGQRVFVHGLSGAVGYAVMALCLRQGATVYGTASERNHEALRALGAHPFVYTNKNWITAMQNLGGVHAAFDPLGFESFDESYSILTTAERSILVGYGGNLDSMSGGKPRSGLPGIAKLIMRNVTLCNKSTTFYTISRDQKTFQPELRTLLHLAKEGAIRVPIKQVWDIDNIKDAHESWGKSPGMGSMLIRISPE